MTICACPSSPKLQAFHVGKLPEPDLSTVAEHLDQCPACESRARELDAQVDPMLAAIRDPAATWGSLPGAGANQHGSGLTIDRSLAQRLGLAPGNLYPFLLPPVHADELGRLGNYRVLRLLGMGGMGYVFLAEDIALSRPVALKVMKPELGQDGESWQRFLREARLMAAIKHEHLATVYQAGQEGSVVYLAMELLEGESLLDWLRKRPKSEAEQILRLACEITTALAVIHRHGLIHRDIKPANIWLEGPTAHVKILDFGLARRVQESVNLTQTGMVVGTPTFMSPEQARGETVDARTDLFSLGAVLYCICTGSEPFSGPNITAVLTALAIDNPRPVHALAPGLPSPLADLVMQLLAKRPDERPPSAEAVLERLREIKPDSSSPGQTQKLLVPGARNPQRAGVGRRYLAAGVAGLLALIALAAFMGIFSGFFRPPTQVAASSQETAPGGALTSKTKEGQRIFINTWKPVASANWPLPPTPKGDGLIPNCFEKISVAGKVSPHGLGLHPSFDGPAYVSFTLGKQYAGFQGSVSLNDSSKGGSDSPMTFAIYGDGVALWKSKPVSEAEDGQGFSISVQGVDVLKLEVSARKKAHGAHGVWLEPFLTK